MQPYTSYFDLISVTQNSGIYLDNQVYLYDVFHNKNFTHHPLKMDSYSICVCTQGKTTGTINLKPYSFGAGFLAINSPGQILTPESASFDFVGFSIGVSSQYFVSLGLPYEFGFNQALMENHVVELSDEMLESLRITYSKLKGIIQGESKYKNEIVKNILCAMFYELHGYIETNIKSKQQTVQEQIVNDFLILVTKEYAKERSVAYYSDKLCITPGYLSTLVPQLTGKGASEWIDGMVILDAKSMLANSNMTIQQIGLALSFPSQSSFGKFFKRITGVNPKEYRQG